MKRLSIILASLILASPLAAYALEGTLEKVKSSGTITFGYREDSPPFSFLGDDKQPTGYSVDLCKQVAAGVRQQLNLPKLSVNWVPVNADSRFSALTDGMIDLECGTTTHTLSRQEQFDFSLLIFVDGGSLIASKNAGANNLGDLSGKKIAVIANTTTEQYLRKVLEKRSITAQLINVKDPTEGIAALEKGSVAAYAADRLVLITTALKAKGVAKLKLLDEDFSYEPYALMLRRGDPDFRLAVDRVLARLYGSNDIEAIFKRWFGFGEDVAPSPLLAAMYYLQALPQ